MKRTVIAALILAAVFSGCKSKPEPAPEYVEKTDAYEVVDHKTKALGQGVPDWVTWYISDGLTGVEAMEAYKDKYVFIGEDSGTNLNALRQWSTGFTVNQEISRLISERVRSKFAGAAVGSPDAAYGRYFENVVETVSEASFSGVRRESDFWLLKRYFKADRKTVDRESYDFYVLMTVDKAVLERQINAVLDSAQTADTAQTSEQKRAVDLVRQSFYEGF
ncbi:MAG: hypothetical protein LBP74_06555 [Treponema sp.]|nr:hypothetical protein [Treponema sp.]